MDSYSHTVSQTQEVSPDKPKPKKAWMSQKKVAIVKESPTIVTTCTKVTQEHADGSICIITTTSPPFTAPIKAKTTKKVATPIRPRAFKKHSTDSDDESTAPVSKKPSTESDTEPTVATFKNAPTTNNSKEGGKFGDNPITFTLEDLTKYCQDPKNSPVNSKITSREVSFINLPDTHKYRSPPKFKFFGGSTQLSHSVACVDDKTIYNLCKD